MRINAVLTKLATGVAAAVFAAVLASGASFAATDFEGKWKVQDTEGNPFSLTLNDDASAMGNRAGEGLNGTWKAEGDTAIINWDSGWTTKIVKEGEQFKKLAYSKGQEPDGPPTHTSDAEKLD